MIKKKKNKEIPIVVKIISILGYIGSATLLFFSILFFVGGSFITGMIPSFFGFTAAFIAAIIAGIFLLFAVLEFFIARGLWNGQEWSRIVLLILQGIGFLSNLLMFVRGDFSTTFSLLIGGLIIYYFGFDEKVVIFFSS